MNELNTREVQCPYCGQSFEVLIDGSVPHQIYIEDCEICCRPINFDVTVYEDGVIYMTTTHENE
jgi:hypothetical protein